MLNRRDLLKLSAAALPASVIPIGLEEDIVKPEFTPEVSSPVKNEIPFRTHYKIRIGDKTFEAKNIVFPSIHQEYDEWCGFGGKSFLYPGKVSYGDLSFRLSFDESNPEDMRKCHDLVYFLSSGFNQISLPPKIEKHSIDILLCKRDSVETYATVQDAFFTSMMWDFDSGFLILNSEKPSSMFGTLFLSWFLNTKPMIKSSFRLNLFLKSLFDFGPRL